jgi:hypothetical protein
MALSSSASPSRSPHFAVLLALAWISLCAVLLADRWVELSSRLYDADDAMRLVEVREFLAGRGWFDLFEARVDPPTGYLTHWSRLVDAGLAGVFLIARSFADADLAERLMRAVWPLLWLLVAMSAVAAATWRIAGRRAAVLSLIIAACALPALQHFKAGRIDHHNVQIALAMAVLAAAVWSDRARHAAAFAGTLTGLAVSIGLEGFLFVAAAGCAIALRFLFDRTCGDGFQSSPTQLARYGIALAASVSAGFFLTVSSDRWSDAACDAIAVNWLVPAVIIGVGFAIAGVRLQAASLRLRLCYVGIIGAAAVAAFLLIEPRCIAGPFALADGGIREIWLAQVDETEPLLAATRGYPLLAAWICAFPTVALLAAAALACTREMRRDFAFCSVVAVFLLSVVLSLAAVKIYSYAMWFGMPLVAVAADRVSRAGGWRAMLARAVTAAMLTPLVVTAAGLIVTQAAAGPDPAKPGMSERHACSRNLAYSGLVGLPPGLVAVEINYGPYVLALTKHSVLAAPYHHLHGGIVAANVLFAGSPEQAHAIAETNRLDYIAVCGDRSSTGETPAAGSLWAMLHSERPPDWLEQVTSGAEGVFTVYRVRR